MAMSMFGRMFGGLFSRGASKAEGDAAGQGERDAVGGVGKPSKDGGPTKEGEGKEGAPLVDPAKEKSWSESHPIFANGLVQGGISTGLGLLTQPLVNMFSGSKSSSGSSSGGSSGGSSSSTGGPGTYGSSDPGASMNQNLPTYDLAKEANAMLYGTGGGGPSGLGSGPHVGGVGPSNPFHL